MGDRLLLGWLSLTIQSEGQSVDGGYPFVYCSWKSLSVDQVGSNPLGRISGLLWQT